MSATMVGRRRKFQVSDGLKRPYNVRNYKFLAKYFYQNVQLFSIFIYNESLPIKSYQFFKISKRFYKEREKYTYAAVKMRKEKLRKVGLCFITGCFIKSFNRHLDINRVIAAESSPLCIAGSRNRTWNLWFTLVRIHSFVACTGSCRECLKLG